MEWFSSDAFIEMDYTGGMMIFAVGDLRFIVIPGLAEDYMNRSPLLGADS